MPFLDRCPGLIPTRASLSVLGIIVLIIAVSWSAVATTAGQAAEETVFLAWRHLQLRGGSAALQLVGRTESVVRLIPIASAVVVALGVVLAAVRSRNPARSARAVGSGLAAVLLTEALKSVLSRPDLVPSGFSDPAVNTLPSGHVTIVASTVLVLAVVASPRARVLIVVVGAVAVAVVGVVVTAIAWHRPSDVITAIAVVALIAVLAGLFERRCSPPSAEMASGGRGRWVLLVAAAVSLAVAVGAAPFVGAVHGGVSGTQPVPVSDLVVPIAAVVAVVAVFGSVVLRSIR